MSKACILNPVSKKPSMLAEQIGFANYNQVVSKYYDLSNPRFIESFSNENAVPVYNPSVMDSNNDFKLFKHTSVKVTPTLTKHKYSPVDPDSETTTEDTLVILPIKTIIHVPQTGRPYAVGVNGKVVRIESFEDIGVSINNIEEINEVKEITILDKLNDRLGVTHSKPLDAVMDMIFNQISNKEKRIIMSLLINKLHISQQLGVSGHMLNRLAVENGLFRKDFDLLTAIDKYTTSKPEIYSSVDFSSTVNIIDSMNQEVKHDESIITDVNGIRQTDPLTGQYLFRHEYHRQKDKNGNELASPQRIQTSVTNEIDISNPFNRYEKILNINLNEKYSNQHRWHKYISKKALTLLLGVSESMGIKDIRLDPYVTLEGSSGRPYYVRFDTKPIMVDIIKAANKGEAGRVELIDMIRQLVKDSHAKGVGLTFKEVNSILGSLTGRAIPDKSLLFNFTYDDTTKASTWFTENNLVDKLRALNFGTIAGTYIHGITQASMAANFYYSTVDANGVRSVDYERMITENSDPKSEYHDFVDYAKEIIHLRDNSPANFDKIKDMIESANRTMDKFRELAADKYSSDTNTEAKIYFENIVVTNEYSSFNDKKQSEKNRTLASKIDVTVIYPNGKVFVIDIKSSTKNAIKANAITSRGVDRYNNKVVEDREYTTHDGLKRTEPVTVEEGYIKGEQIKHGKQLEIYRKMLVSRGVKPENIETYIYFVAVEEIDKTKAIDNFKDKDGNPIDKKIDNVIDSIVSIVVPDFTLSTVQGNRSVGFETEPMAHMIPGDTLHNHKAIQEEIDNILGESTESINRTRESANFQEDMERDAKVKYDNKIDAFKPEMEDIKDRIIKYIEDAERSVKTSKQLSDSDKQDKLKQFKQLKSDVGNITNDVAHIINFIEYAHNELLGVGGKDGLTDMMRNTIVNYKDKLNDLDSDPFESLNKSIGEVQFIYDLMYQFEVLKDISELDTITGGKLLDAGQSQLLKEAMTSYGRGMMFYGRNANPMLAKLLTQYHDTSLDNDYEVIINKALERGMQKQGKEDALFTQRDLDEFKQAIEEGEDVTKGTKYRPAFGQIIKVYDKLHHLKIDEASIVEELDTLQRDIGGLHLHIMGVGMQNNRTLQLMFKMFKSTIAKGEFKTREELTAIDQAFQKYRDAVGGSNDMEKLYKHVLEKKKRKRYNNETQTLEEEDVWQFLAEHDSDYMLERDSLVTQRQEAREQGLKAKEREITRELKTWERDNLQKLYKEDVYLTDDMLDVAINGKDGLLRQKIEAIDEKIFLIRSEYTDNNPAEYSNEHKALLTTYYNSKKQLANIYNSFGVLKTGEDLELAKAFTAYKERRNEIVTSELDNDAYNKAFNEAKVKYKNDPIRLQRWVDANSDIVLNDKFYIDHNFYSTSRNILWTMEQLRLSGNQTRADELEKAYEYEVLSTGNTDRESFVNNMQKFMNDNKFELVKGTDEDTLKIMELLKPYKDNSGRVDYTIVPDAILAIVKKITEKKEQDTLDRFRANDDRKVPKISKDSPYASRYKQITSYMYELKQFTIRSEYYDVVEQLKSESKEVQDKWHKANHVTTYKYVYKKGKNVDDDYDPILEGDTLIADTTSYWVIAKEEPLSIWTRMTPASQETFKMNADRLNTLIKLGSKYDMSTVEVELTNTPDFGSEAETENLGLSDMISLLRSEEGQDAIAELKRVNRGFTEMDLGEDLDIRHTSLKFNGKFYKTNDVINAVINGIKSDLLVKNKAKDDVKVSQHDLDILQDFTLTIKNKDGSESHKLSRKVYELDADKSKFYQRRPNILYNRVKPKKEYYRDDAELREALTDDSFVNGDRKGLIKYEDMKPLPLANKWRNKRYDSMMNDKSAKGVAIREFYTFMTDHYKKKQLLYPPHKRKGLIIPSMKKSSNEMYLNNTSRGTIADQVARRIKETVKRGQDDLEDEGQNDEDNNIAEGKTEFFGSGYNNNSIVIPTMFTQNMPANDVSLDLVSSMQNFSAATNEYNQKASIVDSVRMLNTSFNNREESDRVLERNSDDKLLIRSLAESMGVEGTKKFQGKSETSNVYKAFQKFVEMQFAGINNKPSYIKGWRVDKIVDSAMLFQSKASIGGLSGTALLKGMINTIQASMSVSIEAAGGEFFSLGTVKKVLTSKTHVELWTDQVKEMHATAKGSTMSVTKTGQMMDHYDALQGNFKDSMGDNVSSKALPKLFKSSTWFFNQYLGEYLNSMAVLNAFLEEQKVLDDGTVITWMEYSKSKEIITLSDGDFSIAKQKFYDRKSLRDSIQQNDAGTALEVKAVETPAGSVMPKWELGGKADVDLRLKVQAILREINGSYSQADKTAAQQYWYGRALIMYKKHLVPSIVRRFGNFEGLASQELGSVRSGYHTDHYKTLYQSLINRHTGELRSMLNLYGSIMTGGKFGTGLSERHASDTIDKDGNVVKAKFTLAQIANLRKSIFEHLMLLSMMMLLAVIDIDDDEDKSEVSDARYLLLYTVDRLRREQNSLAISPFAGSNPVTDNWKNLESPSAVIKTGKDVLDIIGLLLGHINPFADHEELYYKGDSGIAEKGDARVYIKTQKTLKSMLPLTVLTGSTARSMYENLNR